MKASSKSVRLFENGWLEMFTHVHPITPLLMWGPVAGYSFWRASQQTEVSVLETLGFAALGLLVWTLTEYVMHRFFFHLKPIGERTKWIQFLIHGVHHDYPEDATRLVMPPVAALAFAVVLYPLFRMTLGPVYIHAFFGAFLVGYLAYDYIHYSVHHIPPRTPIGRYLKQNHMLHHFVMHEARWGVSSPLWDAVFGTLSQRPSSPRDNPAARAQG